MMSLLIAMSIDYSLFLLTRFREELLKILQHDPCTTISEKEVRKVII